MHTTPRENANEFQQPFMSATSPGTANVIRVAFRTYRHRRIRSRRAHSVIGPASFRHATTNEVEFRATVSDGAGTRNEEESTRTDDAANFTCMRL